MGEGDMKGEEERERQGGSDQKRVKEIRFHCMSVECLGGGGEAWRACCSRAGRCGTLGQLAGGSHLGPAD